MGHTVDRVVSIMDASGLGIGSLTGFVQKVGGLARRRGWLG
jgi:hypothetical protein